MILVTKSWMLSGSYDSTGLVDKVLTVCSGCLRSLYLHVVLSTVMHLSASTHVVLAPRCRYPQCGVVLTNALLVTAYIIANCNCCIDYDHPRNLTSHRLISEERCWRHALSHRWSDSVCVYQKLNAELIPLLRLSVDHPLCLYSLFFLQFPYF